MEKGDENPEEIFVDEKVLEVLRESLRKKLKKERTSKKNDDKRAIEVVLKEFLTCAKLFGYDLDGNIVEVSFHSNNLEDNAIQNLFIQKIGEFMAGRMNIQDEF